MMRLETALVCVVASVLVGCGERAEFESAPWVVEGALAFVSPASVSFEEVASGSVSTELVTVLNGGGAPLLVEEVSLSGDSEFELVPAPWVGVQPLEPGEERTLAVSYVPRGAGEHSGALVIITSEGGGSATRVELSGSATAPMPVIDAPEDVVLETTRALETSETVFSVRNLGDAELVVEDIALDGPPGDILIRYPEPVAPGRPPRDSVVFDPSVPPGDELRIKAIFAPERPGAYAFTMTLKTNDPRRPEVVVDITGIADEPEPIGPGNCPVADAGVANLDDDGVFLDEIEVPVDSVVSFYALGSYSPLGVPVEAFEWRIASRPIDSSVLLMPNSRVSAPRFFVDAVGNYTFELDVFDAFGRRSCTPDIVRVTAIATD